MTEVVIRAKLCLNIAHVRTGHMPLIEGLHTVMSSLATLSRQRIVFRFIHLTELTQQADHFQRGHRGFLTLVARLGA